MRNSLKRRCMTNEVEEYAIKKYKEKDRESSFTLEWKTNCKRNKLLIGVFSVSNKTLCIFPN